MIKEICKYPYNGVIDEETKIFFSDRICEQVVSITYTNRQFFFTMKNKISHKKREVAVSAALIWTVLFSIPNQVGAIGVSPIVTSAPEIHKPAPQYFYKYAPTIDARVDRVRFIKPSELPLRVYMMDEQFLRTVKVSKLIRELRGGSLTYALIGNVIFLGVLYSIWLLSGGAEGFVQQPNPGWGLGNNPYEPPGLVRPADCETQLYAGSSQQSLKTEVSRNQPNPKDRWIFVESRPELIMRRGQAKFKTKDHGALTGLPYTIKKNGGTSTARTEENIDRFMDVVEEIIENPNSIWFQDGTYQGGTNREVKSINIYNKEENRLAIFKQSTGEFITFCELNNAEQEDLLKTGNFGGKFVGFSGRAKNVPPKDKAEQNFADEITPIDSFESHVMGITPTRAHEFSSINEGQNPGFTPINSFESDVMGITPLDSSSSNY